MRAHHQTRASGKVRTAHQLVFYTGQETHLSAIIRLMKLSGSA